MSPRSLVTPALAAVLTCLALGPAAAHAVAPIELELRGIEHDRTMDSGNEREVIRAEGDGASLVLHETVECNLKGARCGQLHRGVAHGACEESLVEGELTTRRGTLALRGVGRVCAGLHDRERLWLIGHRGSEELRGVHVLLEVRVAKTVRAGGAGEADVVSVDTLGVETLGIDRDERARSAADPGASRECIVCEFLVGVVHAGEMHGTSDPDRHLSEMARVCVLMPDHWSGACGDMVEQLGAQIVVHATRGLSAEEICVERLGFEP